MIGIRKSKSKSDSADSIETHLNLTNLPLLHRENPLKCSTCQPRPSILRTCSSTRCAPGWSLLRLLRQSRRLVAASPIATRALPRGAGRICRTYRLGWRMRCARCGSVDTGGSGRSAGGTFLLLLGWCWCFVCFLQ